MPANASIDYSEHVWECLQSSSRLGSERVVIDMPANATFDDTGQGWQCLRGYR